MDNIRIQVATHVEDLDKGALPVGTRIATNHNKVLVLDEIEEGRRDSGSRYWIEPLTLQPMPNAMRHWLPAYILPPPREIPD